MPVLSIENLTKRFGGLVAVDSVDIWVDSGEIVGLIGPNGSGKTTLFNCVAGYYKADEGEVRLNDEVITDKRMEAICEKGLYRTFQLPRAFPELSVLQNVLLATQHKHEGLLNILLRAFSENLVARAKELVEFVGLERLISEPAGNLSGGQQKLLELACALMKEPQIVLLDEPTGGVNPTLINDIKARVLEMNADGMTFLIIEHNMHVIMNIAERMYVLDHGTLIAEGTPEEVRNNEQVLEAYFGE
jgi:ABC-type branched-subunit amino acid transport system ATPase component